MNRGLKEKSLCICIYIYQVKKFFPLEYGIGEGSKFVNLLMIPMEDDVIKNVSHHYHFVIVKNIDRYKQTSNAGVSPV
jgi:hypothetical protein